MAKVKNNNFLDTVHTVFSEARKQGALHLYAEDLQLDGVTLTIGGKEMLQFGSTGYLGLEHDLRLKEGAITAIHKYGTQFPLSKSYVSHPLYEELETLVTRMYESPIVITKNSTLGHMGAIPAIVSDSDAIVLDHQVHWSVQSAAKQLKSRSVPIEMIRHNRLDMLEDKLKYFASKARKVWLMADGIYSMFGDAVPIDDLMKLMEKYACLHLYLDDVHGMSWKGPNGTGFIREQLGALPDRVVLTGTLGKTFGAGGAVIACQDKGMQQKIKTFGGPLTFSVQLEPAIVGAAIVSAKLHLTPEIYQMQQKLQDNIHYLYELMSVTELPLVTHHKTPIFYIAAGMPVTGYELVRRMREDGFYINIGIFPGVPIKQTGLRITVSRLHSKSQLKALVAALEYHYPLALKATQTTPNEVRKLFQLPLVQQEHQKQRVTTDLQVTLTNGIQEVNPELWNQTMGKRNVFDWQGMQFLESVYQSNVQPEYHWSFRYVVIKDVRGVPVLVTFLSKALWKEDMLAPASVSEHIEDKRKENPYYLTSKVVSMGCPFTEGQHYYVHQQHPQYRDAWKLLVEVINQWSDEKECRMIVLRDFEKDTPLSHMLLSLGYVPILMPERAWIHFEWQESLQAYWKRLSYRSRKHFRKDIIPFTERFKVMHLGCLEQEMEATSLFLLEAVRKRNLGLNTFAFPDHILREMNRHPNWEFIMLYLLPTYQQEPIEEPKIVGMMCCYKNQGHTYTPAFVGMDYTYASTHQVYRQLLYQTIIRAHTLGFQQVDLGLTAGFEKKKLGARVKEQIAFIQPKDNFTLDWLELLQPFQ